MGIVPNPVAAKASEMPPQALDNSSVTIDHETCYLVRLAQIDSHQQMATLCAAEFLFQDGHRLILIPVVAGISYEVMKLTARFYEKSAFVRLLLAPGLALQRLTTREPDRSMLEVAIRALQEVLRSEGLLAEEVTVKETSAVPNEPAAADAPTL